MVAAAVNSWNTPNWCKPFGAQSNEREWVASTNGVPQKKPRLKSYATPEERQIYRRARRLRDRSFDFCDKPFQITPTLRVRSYAHDRVVLTIFDKLPPVCSPGRSIGASAAEIIRGGAPLVKRRELRRGFKIGNRWRFRPAYNTYTVHGRNMVLDGGTIVERDAEGIGCFVTLTFPGGTRKGYACLGAGAGYCMDRLARWLRYRVVNGYYVYVWELQERGAPHVHMLLRIPAGESIAIFQCHLRAQWRKILDDISNQSGVDLFARTGGGTWRGSAKYPVIQVKRIESTYAAYLSKYASKERTKGGISSPFRPARWWGISKSLRKEVLKSRLDVYIPLARREVGLELAAGLIQVEGLFCKSFKKLQLPPQVVLDSYSIIVGPGVGPCVVAALIAFVDSGDARCFVQALKALSQIWDGKLREVA